MEKTVKRNILWTIAGALAIVALFTNPYHVWTASIIFALGCVQMEDDEREEGRR